MKKINRLIEGRVMDANMTEKQRQLARDGTMEFWEISCNLGWPLQVLSIPSRQTTARRSPSLKLTSSYFYNLHTHRHTHRHTHTHTLLIYERVNAQAQMHTRSLSDSCKHACNSLTRIWTVHSRNL